MCKLYAKLTAKNLTIEQNKLRLWFVRIFASALMATGWWLDVSIEKIDNANNAFSKTTNVTSANENNDHLFSQYLGNYGLGKSSK